MRINRTQKIAFGLLGQSLLLLLLSLAANLFATLKFLPDDPLALSLYYNHAASFAASALHLSLISGFIGSMIYISAKHRGDDRFNNEALLTYTYQAWTAFLVIAFFFGFLGQWSGQVGFELPFWLRIAEVILLLAFIYLISRNFPSWTAIPMVWTVGMLMITIGIILSLIPWGNPFLNQALSLRIHSLSLYVAYPLVALSIATWLAGRFSNTMQLWLDEGLYTMAGLLSLAGAGLSVARLYAFGAAIWPGLIIAILIFVLYGIFIARAYRVLADKNPAQTLAGHWYALFALLLFLSMGILGALLSLPNLALSVQGTQLIYAHEWMLQFAFVALLLGTGNQISAELRKNNSRVTGLLPFWMVSFGLLGGGLAMLIAGITQTYLERILNIGYLQSQTYLIPLYQFWILSLLSLTLGLVIYAWGFHSRRPMSLPEIASGPLQTEDTLTT